VHDRTRREGGGIRGYMIEPGAGGYRGNMIDPGAREGFTPA